MTTPHVTPECTADWRCTAEHHTIDCPRIVRSKP